MYQWIFVFLELNRGKNIQISHDALHNNNNATNQQSITITSLCNLICHHVMFRYNPESAEVSHPQPNSIQDVQTTGATERSSETDGERTVKGRAEEAETPQQAGLPPG